MFLVDTDVISALAPSARGNTERLVAWLDQASAHLFVSAISAGEIKAGIARAQREGAHIKAAHLTDWWRGIEYLYGEKFLPFDLSCAQAAGHILDAAHAHRPCWADIALAATARVHQLTILTRNLQPFSALQVRALDPFMELPRRV